LTAGVPRFLLRNDIEARDRVFKAFEKYRQSDWSDAAEITKTRKRLYDREGVSLQDQAGNQASFNIALLGNTVPTAFWGLYHVIQRPQLLHDIRMELDQNAVVKTEAQGQSSVVLDVSALRTQCPLLLSSYQESQRTKSQHANIRQALEDTTIESPTTGARFFFAKGQYIQMPSGPIHKNTSIWGPTAKDFDPSRFAKANAVTRKGESYAFMPWGSAPHLCPARQFASTEVMLFMAFMVLRFDFAPGDGTSKWVDPGHDDGEFTTLPPPKAEVLLNIRRRGGWQGRWELRCGDSNKKIPLASG
jgi:cytochrome P450